MIRISIVIIGLLYCAVACEEKQKAQTSVSVVTIKPEIIRTLPHDTRAFTQGLTFYDSFLFESTGRRGQSSLRKIDPHTGDILARVPVRQVFAEGLTVYDNTLVQLTWRAGIAFVYSYPQLRIESTMHYGGEGWGLTAADRSYIMSDGSNVLYWRNAAFKVTRKMPVLYKGKPLRRLNELEWARNRIYVNVWYSNYIFEISPSSGVVMRIVDCRELAEMAGPLGDEDVLNGIAWEARSGHFFVTGKNWPKLFEIRIPSDSGAEQ